MTTYSDMDYACTKSGVDAVTRKHHVCSWRKIASALATPKRAGRKARQRSRRAARPTRVIDAVGRLQPRVFENLSFDLLVMAGMTNTVWRTPGADGGRDIEGDVPIVDFSENNSVQHWYIECKRYGSAVDWPTVAEKLAYADNHGADYLLFITTATLSPQCLNELQLREQQRRRPHVRAWTGPVLELMLSRYPVLLAKYALGGGTSLLDRAAAPVARVAADAVRAAYGETGQPGPALEFATTLLELLSARLAVPASVAGSLGARPMQIPRDSFPWLVIQTPPANLAAFDSYGMRASLAAVRFLSKAATLTITPVGDAIRVTGCGAIGRSLLTVLGQVTVWSGLEFDTTKANSIVIRARM